MVAFDEFAGKQKRVDKALVDIMKNYMANKSFSRGVETLGAEASIWYSWAIPTIPCPMLNIRICFDPLPDKFHDSAFLDRIPSTFRVGGGCHPRRCSQRLRLRGRLPRRILRSLRSHDFSDRYKGTSGCRTTSQPVTATASTRPSRA